MTAGPAIAVYRSRSLRRSERWRWRLWVNGRIVAEAGEGYSNQAEAMRMSRRVVGGAYAGADLVVDVGRRPTDRSA